MLSESYLSAIICFWVFMHSLCVLFQAPSLAASWHNCVFVMAQILSLPRRPHVVRFCIFCISVSFILIVCSIFKNEQD